MKAEREAFIAYLKSNDLIKTGRERAIRTIEASDIKAHGKTIPFSYLPLFINSRDLAFWDGEIGKIQEILRKMTRHYIEHPAYRALFGFSPEMEELICLPCPYEEVIPVGRYDVFYDEVSGSYGFCEFNTDGSGGMSRDYEISKAILTSCGLDPDEGPVRCFDTIDRIADSLIGIYRSSEGAEENPCFAVTDFREEGVMSDFDRFIAAFRRRGLEARFTDIRDLIFDGEHLTDRTDGQVIHGIYRRAVTSVILEHLEECRDLIEAVKAKKVVLMGHFRTSLAHSKTVMCVMNSPETRALLTDAENEYIEAHIPMTVFFDREHVSPELLNEVRDHRDDWVIKPEEGFASHGVVCGRDRSFEEWNKILTERMDGQDILQRFFRRYEMPLLGPSDPEIRAYPLMLGIYQASGRAVGFYSRAGREGVIDFDHGGICVSTVYTPEGS